MSTTIHNNGSGKCEPVDALLERLAKHTLDPTFEAYGAFQIALPELPNVVRFWGNFFDVSAVFSIDTDDPDLIRRLNEAIEANMSTPAYAKAREERAEERRRHLEAEEQRRKRDRIR